MMTKERFLMLITESVRTSVTERIATNRMPTPNSSQLFITEHIEMLARNAASTPWLEIAAAQAEQREADIDGLNAHQVMHNAGARGKNLEQMAKDLVSRGAFGCAPIQYVLADLAAAVASGDHRTVIATAERVVTLYASQVKS